MVASETNSELKKLIENAFRISMDTGIVIEAALKDAVDQPMTAQEFQGFLKGISAKLRAEALKRSDKITLDFIDKEIDQVINQALTSRNRILSEYQSNSGNIVKLSKFNGLEPGPVHPKPTFHGREIPMNGGGVKTTDIKLWDRNERLDIHIGQFKAAKGREPDSQELLDLMLSKMPLPGLKEKDQFKIVELALSIANNGVRKPPIIDLDGTLLDGNRRVAACYYILNSPDFNTTQKKRAENIFVWQLTEHADADDRNAVVVSLNFEPDCKQSWPEYVKAKVIYAEWQTMLALEPRPGAARLAQLRRELASRFGYGTDTYTVTRYIKMVDSSNEFEDHLINEKHYDTYEVKHQANKYFQYFDELSKGSNPGGVAHTLNQNEPFKHLVYDLLFQGKFRNWTLIRLLKYYNSDMHEAFIKARETKDVDEAMDEIDIKLNELKAQDKTHRIGNPNHRIQVFTKWFEQLPISAFRDDIHVDNLRKLHAAFMLVESQLKEIDPTAD